MRWICSFIHHQGKILSFRLEKICFSTTLPKMSIISFLTIGDVYLAFAGALFNLSANSGSKPAKQLMASKKFPQFISNSTSCCPRNANPCLTRNLVRGKVWKHEKHFYSFVLANKYLIKSRNLVMNCLPAIYSLTLKNEQDELCWMHVFLLFSPY